MLQHVIRPVKVSTDPIISNASNVTVATGDDLDRFDQRLFRSMTDHRRYLGVISSAFAATIYGIRRKIRPEVSVGTIVHIEGSDVPNVGT